MDEEKLLHSATKWQRRTKVKIGTLGTIAQRYLNERSRRFGKNASVVDAWHRILPEKFYEHCRIAGISKGVLSLEAEPGPYMHEMQLAGKEILEQLQSCCGRTAIKEIKICPMKEQRKGEQG